MTREAFNEFVRDLIVNARGGVPSKCDFCGKETPERYLHPEEGGEWMCISCINKDPEAYYGRPIK